ncbi:MAG: glycosyltransferase, partial [Streptomyces sp.]
LRPGAQGTVPVRFGRLLGDLADRKKTDLVPRVRLGETETGLRLYFSLSNDLVVALQPLPLAERAEVLAADAAPATPSAPTAHSASSSPSTSASST